jgi:hypothetical protein
MSDNSSIQDFSPHLFWDVDKNVLDVNEHKEQIVYQVVEYGLWSDWLLLQKVYTYDELKKIVLKILF